MTISVQSKSFAPRGVRGSPFRAADFVVFLVVAGFSSVVLSPPTVADNVNPGMDLWTTVGQTFYDLTSSPVPADFFGPGSDPFGGTIQFVGDPLPAPFAPADTIVERLAPATLPCPPDPFTMPGGCCDPPPPPPTPPCSSATIPIEIVALSLKSATPITVTFNGGQNPEQWSVKVCLSSNTPQPTGSMTIRHECPDGGTFDSTLTVVPKLIFTRLSDGATEDLDPAPECSLTATDGGWIHDPINLQNLEPDPPCPPPNVKKVLGATVDGDCDGTNETTVSTSNFFPGFRPVPCNQCCPEGLECPIKERVQESGTRALHEVTPPPPPLPICGDNVVNRPGEVCDGTDDLACPGQCLPNCKCPDGEPIPTVSEWGLIVLGLLLLVGAKVYFGRRRRASTPA